VIHNLIQQTEPLGEHARLTSLAFTVFVLFLVPEKIHLFTHIKRITPTGIEILLE